MENKYVFSYLRYLKEQDMGAPVTYAGQEAAPKKEKVFTFLFISEKDNTAKKYPDGSSKDDIATYTIKESALKKWLDTNIKSTDDVKMTDSEIGVKKKALTKIISGEKTTVSPDEKKLLEKFKNAVTSGLVGKKIADTEVIFSHKEKNPTTNELDVTFIFV